eukprot:COSAG01_NODE_2911_length_6875_cov_93.023318_4_plen_139_part_00
MSSEGTEACSHAPAASDTAAAGRQIYSCTVIRSAKSDLLPYSCTARASSLNPAAQQAAHQNLLVEPPLAWQPGHRLRRITARIPSLKMDLSATAVRPVQVLVVATARKSTPLHLYTFSDFPKKHWLSVSHLKGIVSKY